MKILSPAVQHTKEAQPHAETFGIGGDGEQGLSGGAEENLVDDLLVVEGEGGDGRGQSEDHVEVLDG